MVFFLLEFTLKLCIRYGGDRDEKYICFCFPFSFISFFLRLMDQQRKPTGYQLQLQCVYKTKRTSARPKLCGDVETPHTTSTIEPKLVVLFGKCPFWVMFNFLFADTTCEQNQTHKKCITITFKRGVSWNVYGTNAKVLHWEPKSTKRKTEVFVFHLYFQRTYMFSRDPRVRGGEREEAGTRWKKCECYTNARSIFVKRFHNRFA